MQIKELICIGCPIGCRMEVKIEGTEVISVHGNTCKKGEQYALTECKNPVRTVTSTVRIKNGISRTIPVKTHGEIPKDKIMQVIQELGEIELEAPVYIGDVIIHNAAGTKINIIATKSALK